MCEHCYPQTEQQRLLGFVEDMAEHFQLMSVGKKHNTIDSFTAQNWSEAFVDVANLLRQGVFSDETQNSKEDDHA